MSRPDLTPAAGMAITYNNPVITWRSELKPDRYPSGEPPPGPFTVTRSAIFIQASGAPVVHIWWAAIPAVPAREWSPVSANTAYLREHGDDTVPVKIIDLLGAVARMGQVSREPGFETGSVTHERIFTCDLPRLRRYLPDGAQAVLAEDGW